MTAPIYGKCICDEQAELNIHYIDYPILDENDIRQTRRFIINVFMCRNCRDEFRKYNDAIMEKVEHFKLL